MEKGRKRRKGKGGGGIERKRWNRKCRGRPGRRTREGEREGEREGKEVKEVISICNSRHVV